VVAEEETGSQVVLLEDEPDGTPSARKRGRKPVDEDAGDVDLADVEEEESSVSSALKGVKSRHAADEDDEVEVAGAGRLAPRPWGPLPALILFPALLVVTLGGLMGYELLHTMMGY